MSEVSVKGGLQKNLGILKEISITAGQCNYVTYAKHRIWVPG